MTFMSYLAVNTVPVLTFVWQNTMEYYKLIKWSMCVIHKAILHKYALIKHTATIVVFGGD